MKRFMIVFFSLAILAACNGGNGESDVGNEEIDVDDSENGTEMDGLEDTIEEDGAEGVQVPPEAPTQLQAVLSPSSNTTISLTWVDASINEDGFSIERTQSVDCSSGFAEIARVGTDVVSYDDPGLALTTFYCYRIAAFNGAGSSAFSNTAGATTGNPPVNPPAAPSDLQARAISTSDIILTWADNSNNESSFVVERSSSCASGFAMVGTAGADRTEYHDGGLAASTSYCYRVMASNSVGNSAYSNTANVATLDPPSYTLGVIKAGTGLPDGTVTGTGIACGTDCSEQYPGGTVVTLTASTSGSTMFQNWSGCDSASGATCTVTMTADRTVTATFGISVTIEIFITSLPATDNDGNYTLQWDCTSMLCCSPYTIEEDSDPSFSSPTGYLSYDTTRPYTYDFTGKADGTYCYRVGCAGENLSEPACIVVSRPSSGTVRVQNNTHYYIVDVQLNGVQMVEYPYGIGAGGYFDFVVAPGAINYYLGSGYYDEYGSRDVWFNRTGTTSVSAGSSTTVTFDNPTIGQLLSNFSSSRNWTGDYYCYSCPIIVNYATYNFTSSGGWQFYDNGVFQESGTVQLVSWPDYSDAVTFRLCPSCESISLAYPFSQFYFRNGPSDWPLILYVAD